MASPIIFRWRENYPVTIRFRGLDTSVTFASNEAIPSLAALLGPKGNKGDKGDPGEDGSLSPGEAVDGGNF